MSSAASTIPAAIRQMTPGTVPIGTLLPGFGTVERTSLTAYFVRGSSSDLGHWLPFVHVHDLPAAEPLVVLG